MKQTAIERFARTRVPMGALTEKETFVEIEKGQYYGVPAKVRHQIVYDEVKGDIGIALSRNGRTDFRRYRTDIIYWFCNPTHIVTNPIGGGRCIDLSGLV